MLVFCCHLKLLQNHLLIILITVNTKWLSRRLRHYMLPLTSDEKLTIKTHLQLHNSNRRHVEFSWVELRGYRHPRRRNSTVARRRCNWPSCSVQPISAKQVSRVELSYVAINGPLVSKVGSHLNGLTFFVSVSNGYMLRDRVDGRVALTLRDRLLFGGNGTSWGTCIRNRNWLSLSIVLANTQLSLQPSLQRVPQFFGYGTLNNILWSAKHITQYNWH